MGREEEGVIRLQIKVEEEEKKSVVERESRGDSWAIYMLSRYALRYGKVELNEAAEECSELFRVSISSVLRKQLCFFDGCELSRDDWWEFSTFPLLEFNHAGNDKWVEESRSLDWIWKCEFEDFFN